MTESRLDRIVSAQFVRLLPHDFQNGIYLRLEIMGCGDGWWKGCWSYILGLCVCVILKCRLYFHHQVLAG